MTYKEYWAYQEVTKNWESDIVISEDGKSATVTIWYDKSDNDIYATFEIMLFTVDDIENSDTWFIYDTTGGEHMILNDYVDFTETLDECIKSCFYYFHTRY